jgi:hypothetical protein
MDLISSVSAVRGFSEGVAVELGIGTLILRLGLFFELVRKRRYAGPLRLRRHFKLGRAV